MNEFEATVAAGEVGPVMVLSGEADLLSAARFLAVHVLGAFHVLKHGAPHVPDRGSIIITSSVVGLMGFPGISGYIAAKHAQVGLMRAAAKELASRRIRVNTLHPGPTSTAFQDDIEMRAPDHPARRQPGSSSGLVPLGRHSKAGGDRSSGALSSRGRERHGDLAHFRDRRRLERLTASPKPAPGCRCAGSKSRLFKAASVVKADPH